MYATVTEAAAAASAAALRILTAETTSAQP
jgi:hypothetical protein